MLENDSAVWLHLSDRFRWTGVESILRLIHTQACLDQSNPIVQGKGKYMITWGKSYPSLFWNTTSLNFLPNTKIVYICSQRWASCKKFRYAMESNSSMLTRFNKKTWRRVYLTNQAGISVKNRQPGQRLEGISCGCDMSFPLLLPPMPFAEHCWILLYIGNIWVWNSYQDFTPACFVKSSWDSSSFPQGPGCGTDPTK